MYTLRFPFGLPPGREIQMTELAGELGGLPFSLKKQDRFYVLTINGFPTEDAARRYINNVWAGLMWLLLHRGLPPDASFEPGKVVYAEDPYQAAESLRFREPVDGLIDGGQPAVYPTEKRVRTITAGQVTVLVTTHADDVLLFFRQGVSFPGSANVMEDPKLRVAFELYGAYFTEFSANARFLTLVMALEALAPSTVRPQTVLKLLDRWTADVEALRETLDRDSDDAASLEALSRELLFRREDSIRRQIRTLVFTTLQANEDEDAGEMAGRAVLVYDRRSTLVHEGKLEESVLSAASADARNIVERVLRVRFLRKARPSMSK